MPGTDAAPVGERPAVDFFADPAPERYSVESAVELDFSAITREFLDALPEKGAPAQASGRRWLLPPDHVWQKDGKTWAPMALCELVAYRTALAYESEADIRAVVGDAPEVGFFDSSRDGVGDTQGFVFSHDGIVFVILRGTEKGRDWTTNLQDQLTDELCTGRRDKLVKDLKKRHGERVVLLLDGLAARPGRHLGFSIGWAAVHDQIAGHLEEHWPPGTPVVVAGHSLGGALALIGALELKRAGHDIAAVITFGAPQVGNDNFARDYAAEGLHQRTVLFEAQGDSVPRLLRRWYYRLGSNLRSRLVGLVTPGPEPIPRAAYAVCGTPWTFVAQPALSAGEVKDAVKHILEARAQRAKEEAERKAKAEQERNAKEQQRQAGAAAEAEKASPSVSSAAPQATSPAQGTGAGQATSGKTGDAQGQGPEASGSALGWILGAIGLLVLALTVWLVVRSKLSAHAIIERYALFLSTLSYQHIRALRAAEAGSAEERLRRANNDLGRYLRFIRGEGAYLTKVKADGLPVRLEPDLDLAAFLSEPKNII